MPTSVAVFVCLVLHVVDGDTLRVLCDGNSDEAPTLVRVHAIDAPERGQPFGSVAQDAMRSRVEHQAVRLRCVDTDSYARSVCQVFEATSDGRSAQSASGSDDVGLQLVEQGLAWWYRQFAGTKTPEERARYALAERQARLAQRGLLRDGARAQPPWLWRRNSPRNAAGAVKTPVPE